jgi:hypothetical protein
MSNWDSIKENALNAMEQIKKGAKTAADKAGELGRIGALKVEIANIQSKINKNFIHIGSETFVMIHEKNDTQISENAEIQTYITDIVNLKKEIDEKEAEIESLSQQENTTS